MVAGRGENMTRTKDWSYWSKKQGPILAVFAVNLRISVYLQY